jgi:hypothetical protein
MRIVKRLNVHNKVNCIIMLGYLPSAAGFFALLLNSCKAVSLAAPTMAIMLYIGYAYEFLSGVSNQGQYDGHNDKTYLWFTENQLICEY